MAKEEGRLSNAVKLKKAGVPTLAVVLLTIFSAPGFWEFFFDTAEKDAHDQARKSEQKVDVAYDVLRTSFENQSKELATIRDDMREIRTFLREVLWMRALTSSEGSGHGRPPRLPRPRPTGLGGGGSGSLGGDVEMSGSDEGAEEIAADNDKDGVPDVIQDDAHQAQAQQQALPQDLDALLK